MFKSFKKIHYQTKVMSILQVDYLIDMRVRAPAGSPAGILFQSYVFEAYEQDIPAEDVAHALAMGYADMAKMDI